MKRILAAGACLALLAAPVAAQQAADEHAAMAMPEGFSTEPVLRTGQTRDGDPIVYPQGAPEIVSVRATIEPGGRTPLHQHPVPTFVYVLEGQVELETEGGDPHPYGPGQAYVEALNRDHQLFNRGEAPATILVVFAGAEGTPTTVTAAPTQ